MTGNLALLASYPKSGNTWLRLVLANLLSASDAPVSINKMNLDTAGYCNRELFDTYSPWPASELDQEQIDAILPDVLQDYAAVTTGLTFLKTHSMAGRNHAGRWLAPPSAVRAVLFLVRHPFDVAISFANHFGITVDKAIDAMCQPGFRIASQKFGLPSSLPELYGSWSEHTKSWLDRALPYHMLRARYEDLLQTPAQLFAMLAAGAGVSYTPASLSRAIEHARFDQLKEQEERNGFIERPVQSKVFFRQGKSGGWRKVLSAEQRRRLAESCGEAMQLAGYGIDGEVLQTPSRFQELAPQVA